MPHHDGYHRAQYKECNPAGKTLTRYFRRSALSVTNAFHPEQLPLAPIARWFWKAWHTAAASPSVASRDCGVSSNVRRVLSMAATCSLTAFPLPVTDCLIFRGAYSKMGIFLFNAAAIATPCARPSF